MICVSSRSVPPTLEMYSGLSSANFKQIGQFFGGIWGEGGKKYCSLGLWCANNGVYILQYMAIV